MVVSINLHKVVSHIFACAYAWACARACVHMCSPFNKGFIDDVTLISEPKFELRLLGIRF